MNEYFIQNATLSNHGLAVHSTDRELLNEFIKTEFHDIMTVDRNQCGVTFKVKLPA